MKEKPENYNDQVGRLFPDKSGKKVRSVTMQVTDACNLCCSYCYQINKAHNYMDIDLAKQFIDMLLRGDSLYINYENTNGLILEFIGGEPFMAIKLIREITEYAFEKMIREKHPWLRFFRICISTNGTLYFQPEVQAYLREFGPWICLGVSIDGNRTLHDSCRVFPDGTGSYDLAAGAALHYMKHFEPISCKMTLAPANIGYTADAIWNLLNLGYDEIFVNCVYEEGWTLEHASVLYNQMKKLSDALLRTGRSENVYIRLYDEDYYMPFDPAKDDDKNWCGGNGDMLAVDWRGNLFPCLRYMESSLGNDVEPIIIGTVEGGLEATEKQKHWVDCLKCMTRTSQSTEECINCPIGKGCAWCFPAGTKVATPAGLRDIETLKPGDEVTDGNGDTQTISANMERTVGREDLVYVKAAGFPATLVTKEHPFRTRRDESEEWIPAGELIPGDEIALYEPGGCTWAEVDPCDLDVPESETVYNLTVEGTHTYVANGAIVHNCSAYNYQHFKCLNKRATFICCMHKATALANVYFWNKYYRQKGETKRKKCYVPREWALEIIPESEYEMLLELAKED